MTSEEILNEWKTDSKIDRTELGEAASSVPSLHAKYIEIFFAEKAKYLKSNSEFNNLKKLRWEYWQGILAKEDLEHYGWEQQPLKILRQDMQMYLDSDSVLVAQQLKIDVQKEKVNLLEQIIKSINTMGYNINAAITYEKFKYGT